MPKKMIVDQLRLFYATLIAMLVVTGVFTLPHAAFAQGNAAFALHDGDHVVMYGDSITAQRQYTVMAETFVTTRYPKLAIDWTDSGWSGDRVGGGGGGAIDLRLTRDVIAYKPTVVTIMLGMNDGGYKAYDDATFGVYSKGYEHIVDRLTKEVPGVRLTLIGPSPYDDVTQDPKFPGGYNATLVKYSEYLKGLAQKTNQSFADLNAPVVAMLVQAKANDAVLSTRIMGDRIHPSPAGHLAMAEALLKSWNASPLVAAVTIDAAGKRATLHDNATVTDLKVDDTVSWTEIDGSLPYPIELADPTTALVAKSSDLIDALDREPLIVTGLPAPSYSLSIDGKPVGTFTSAQLATGVNLAILPTPMIAQAKDVSALVVAHNNAHAARWYNIDVPLAADTNPAIKQPLADLDKALIAEEMDTVAKLRALAQPSAHKFALTPVGAPAPAATLTPVTPNPPAATTTPAAVTTPAVAASYPDVKLPFTFVCPHCGINITIKTVADWSLDCTVCPCGTTNLGCYKAIKKKVK